jgi:hypothetical protein
MSNSEGSYSENETVSEGYEAEPSWLDWLPRHPIFSQSDLASDPLPPSSPNLSAIDLASEASSDVDAADQTFHAPRILSASNRAQTLALIRETELVVAVGSELRICNLATVKSKLDAQEYGASTSRLEDYGSYKVRSLKLCHASFDPCQILDVPAVDFPVVSLVPSPNNPKLLAVMGESQVVVVVIPRKEWSALVSSSIVCKTAAVGAFYHSKAAPPIVSVKWHPLGWKGAALCVLTSDCVMREYDLNGDAGDPVNTLDFGHEGLVKKSKGKHASFSTASLNASSSFNSSFHNSTFMLNDPDDEEAVALCFGTDGTAWGEMTVYCMLGDGTVYAACPYLPSDAQVMPACFANTYTFSQAMLQASTRHRPGLHRPCAVGDTLSASSAFERLGTKWARFNTHEDLRYRSCRKSCHCAVEVRGGTSGARCTDVSGYERRSDIRPSSDPLGRSAQDPAPYEAPGTLLAAAITARDRRTDRVDGYRSTVHVPKADER